MANENLTEANEGTSVGERTVLLVDDDRGVRLVLERMVVSLGFRVLSAPSGEEALALALTEPVSVLVCDVALPRMNGYEVARRLSADSPETRVLFISGYSRDVLAERDGHMEGAPHLAKPFAFAAFAAAIADLMAGEQLAA